MKKTQKLLTGAASIAALLLAACGPQSAEQAAAEAKTADLVYVNWAEGVAYTHLAEAVLRDKMGYEVELTAADVAPAYTAVAQGSHDAYMECWRELHQDYLDRYGDSLVSLGNVYEGTETGLAVPTYVTIDTIAELNDHADKFNGVITGIDAGAGMMKKTENELIPEYGLENISLMASSGPAMTAALADAYENEEWIVVTAWKPHWMFGRFDMKFLEQDPDNVIWNTGDIEIIGRAGLAEDKPELEQFLRNMYLTDAELSDLMVQINDSEEPVADVAKAWMEANPEVVADWIPQG
jgi:glycine betaine/proline transport system substrate-binding protein